MIINFKFFKFAATGGLGTITNLLVFSICHDSLGFIPLSASVTAFIVASFQNFIINNFFTFKNKKLSFQKYIKYFLSCISGLAINLIVLQSLLLLFSQKHIYLFQLIGIFCGMFANYFFSSRFIFVKNKV